MLHKWFCGEVYQSGGIPFMEFESITQNLCHALIAIPVGKDLLSRYNQVISKHPAIVYFHHNELLAEAIHDCSTLHQESTTAPILCKELVRGWPIYIRIKDTPIAWLSVFIQETARMITANLLALGSSSFSSDFRKRTGLKDSFSYL